MIIALVLVGISELFKFGLCLTGNWNKFIKTAGQKDFELKKLKKFNFDGHFSSFSQDCLYKSKTLIQ